jgi:predicted transcriptional regulator
MPEIKINDTKMLRLIDKEKKTQAEAAKILGVSRQAVNTRLRQLRGRTTYVVAAAHAEKAVESKLDVVSQLREINDTARCLLEKSADDAHLSVKLMAEIRNQLRLMMDVYTMLYSLEGAAEFQQAVLETLEACDPDLRKTVITRLNEKSALRTALRFQ